MPYAKVEDSQLPAQPPAQITQGGGKSPGYYGMPGERIPYHKVASSGTMIAHTVWRCTACRAMCVTQQGTQPPKKCGKCGR